MSPVDMIIIGYTLIVGGLIVSATVGILAHEIIEWLRHWDKVKRKQAERKQYDEIKRKQNM